MLLQSAAVVGTVVGIILIYIPFVILCRRLDKKDKHKVRTKLDNVRAISSKFDIPI